MTWNLNWLFSSQLFRQRNYICSTLNASWYWILIFKYVSLHSLIKNWSLIRDCRTSIVSDMTIRVSCLVKKIISAERWTRHDTELLSSQLYHQKTAFVVLLIFRYLFAARLSRDLITYSCLQNVDRVAILTWKILEDVTISMTARISCSIKWIAFTEFLNASRYQWLARINCIVKKLAFVVSTSIRFCCVTWSWLVLRLVRLFLISDYFLSISMSYKLIREF